MVQDGAARVAPPERLPGETLSDEVVSGEVLSDEVPSGEVPSGEVLLAVRGVSKSFGPTRALQAVSIEGRAGSVHAVLGENGAGKSTLMKVMAGVLAPDEGEVVLRGAAVRFRDPAAARDAGISTIFQEFCLLPNLSIAENLFLGREREDGRTLGRTEMRERVAAALRSLDLDLDPDMPVGALGVGDQQMVEIAKGVLGEADVFIFDEPTAALASHEVDTLFALIRRLAAGGKAIFYISHRLDEIFALCDTVTVMKDGERVVTLPTAETDHDRVVAAMVGRPLSQLFPPRAERTGRALLVAEALRGRDVPPVALSLHAGEIVGIAGLEGQGQHALMRLLAGFAPATGGTLRLGEADVTASGARARMAAGLGFVPESRKDDGLFPSLDVLANMEAAATARSGLFAWVPSARRRVDAVMGDLNVKAVSARQNVMALSGGNQQKVVLGRWLVSDTRVLLCEEPTRGVDVRAKREIYLRLRALADAGRAVLATSRELLELIGLCDRILVIRGGALVAEFAGGEADEATLLQAALPGADAPARDAA